MNMEYYIFALFVFALVVIVLALVFKWRSQRQKEKQTDYEDKMQKLMVTYFEIEDMANSLRDYIAHTSETLELQYKKLEFEASKMEEMREQRRAEASHVIYQSNVTRMEQMPVNRVEIAPPQEVSAASQSAPKCAQEVLRMLAEGKNEDQIAEALAISKAEIRFIAKVNK